MIPILVSQQIISKTKRGQGQTRMEKTGPTDKRKEVGVSMRKDSMAFERNGDSDDEEKSPTIE